MSKLETKHLVLYATNANQITHMILNDVYKLYITTNVKKNNQKTGKYLKNRDQFWRIIMILTKKKKKHTHTQEKTFLIVIIFTIAVLHFHYLAFSFFFITFSTSFVKSFSSSLLESKLLPLYPTIFLYTDLNKNCVQ